MSAAKHMTINLNDYTISHKNAKLCSVSAKTMKFCRSVQVLGDVVESLCVQIHAIPTKYVVLSSKDVASIRIIQP
jgi:hypothetical protein